MLQVAGLAAFTSPMGSLSRAARGLEVGMGESGGGSAAELFADIEIDGESFQQPPRQVGHATLSQGFVVLQPEDGQPCPLTGLPPNLFVVSRT
jgi:hypothetical protein